MENKQPTFGNGKICYIEIPAIDVEASVAFYKNVFDWRIRHREDGSVSFDDKVGEVSGAWVTGREISTTVGVLIHIMVYDIVATVDLIKANGGKIIDPPDLAAREVISRFTDPAGNIFSLYQHRQR